MRRSPDWPVALRGSATVREEAITELRTRLLRGARLALSRQRVSLIGVPIGELDDLATQAADAALAAILNGLDSFSGASRFMTWASKFVVVEVGVRARRRAWQGGDPRLEIAARSARDPGAGLERSPAEAEALRAIRAAAGVSLTPHQREVFTALALDGVPIDVLAERFATTRGALYETLQHARRRLRAALADAGMTAETVTAYRSPFTK